MSLFQTKEQKEIVKNLTVEEKAQYIKLSKITGMKLGLSFMPAMFLSYLIAEVWKIESFVIPFAVIWFINLLVSVILISVPTRKRVVLLLNNSKYAKNNNMKV